MTDVFDKVLASRPVNKNAARILSSGTHYEPKQTTHQRHSRAPFPMRPVTDVMRADPCFADLTGSKFGQLLVVGLLDKGAIGQSKNATSQWVVRCVCSSYETRSKKALLAMEPSDMKCFWCRKTDWIRSGCPITRSNDLFQLRLSRE